MAQAFKCDKCGILTEDAETTRKYNGGQNFQATIFYQKRDNKMDLTEADLCKDCQIVLLKSIIEDIKKELKENE